MQLGAAIDPKNHFARQVASGLEHIGLISKVDTLGNRLKAAPNARDFFAADIFANINPTADGNVSRAVLCLQFLEGSIDKLSLKTNSRL